MLAEKEILHLHQKVISDNDASAFSQLYVAFLPKLLPFAQSIIKNKELSEEIVSDVFIKVWERRERLKDIVNFKLYLYVSTKNTALNYLKRHFRKNVISIDDMNIDLSSATYTPEQILISTELINKINSAISMLPAKCKLIFKLAKEDGLKYNEIAHLLNISIKTIDSQMAIAIKRIAATINFNLEKRYKNNL